MRSALVLFLTMLATVPAAQAQRAAAADAPIDAVSAKCRAGKADKCLEAGNRYRFGTNAPVDVALAAEHYDRACKGGHKYGCKALYEIGFGYLKGRDHRGKKAVEDHAKAAEAFERSCSGNYGPGCTCLGEAFLRGDGVAKNATRANELFILGCKRGSPRGCFLAGEASVGTDPAGAKTFFDKGCRWEDSASCAALGRMYLEGAGAPKDAKRAFDYFLQSCNKAPDDNAAAGCFSLAGMYDRGAGVAANREEAVRLYRLACTAVRPKQAEACVLLARAFKAGDGIASDANASGQYFRQACELGNDEGCVEWHRDTCNRLGQRDSCAWLEKRGVDSR